MLPTRKYGVPPEEVEKKSLESEEYKLNYDFKRLKKSIKDVAQHSRYDKKVDKRKRKILRSPLNVGEVVYALPGRLKKKDAPSVFYKNTTDKKSFFNKDKRFVITGQFENHRSTEFYRVQELDTEQRVDGRFLRKEIFASRKKCPARLIVQNDVTVNENDESFNLNFAVGYLEGRKSCFCLKMTISW